MFLECGMKKGKKGKRKKEENDGKRTSGRSLVFFVFLEKKFSRFFPPFLCDFFLFALSLARIFSLPRVLFLSFSLCLSHSLSHFSLVLSLSLDLDHRDLAVEDPGKLGVHRRTRLEAAVLDRRQLAQLSQEHADLLLGLLGLRGETRHVFDVPVLHQELHDGDVVVAWRFFFFCVCVCEREKVEKKGFFISSFDPPSASPLYPAASFYRC